MLLRIIPLDRLFSYSTPTLNFPTAPFSLSYFKTDQRKMSYNYYIKYILKYESIMKRLKEAH